MKDLCSLRKIPFFFLFFELALLFSFQNFVLFVIAELGPPNITQGLFSEFYIW